MPEQIKINHSETLQPGAEQSQENLTTPETSSEKSPVSQEVPVAANSATTPSGVQALPETSTAEAQRLADIERILEEDLSEIYFKLPVENQANFRVRGEATAREINTLLSATTIKLKKIIDAIRSWLKLIPGISQFFLEQEAKIKADRLLKLPNDR